MAKRRMILTELVSSDDFSSLPLGVQALYFHLNLNADDDGFVGGVVGLLRKLGVERKTLLTLRDKGYVIVFRSGVVLIRHWLLHNKIRSDRYTETRFTEEFSNVEISVNKTYEIKDTSQIRVKKAPQKRNQPSAEESVGEVKKGKESLNKQSKVNESAVEDSATPDAHCHRDAETEAEAFPPKIESFEERLDEAGQRRYRDFLRELTLHFMKCYKSVDVERFIRYNEGRQWIGRDGESVIENYKKYAAEWMEKEFVYGKDK